MRSADVVRAAADGRLDFRIVREDPVPKGMKQWKLGEVGCALFAANSWWKGRSSVGEMLHVVPVAELLPGGQFSVRSLERSGVANGVAFTLADVLRLP